MTTPLTDHQQMIDSFFSSRNEKVVVTYGLGSSSRITAYPIKNSSNTKGIEIFFLLEEGIVDCKSFFGRDVCSVRELKEITAPQTFIFLIIKPHRPHWPTYVLTKEEFLSLEVEEFTGWGKDQETHTPPKEVKNSCPACGFGRVNGSYTSFCHRCGWPN
jgi:hypothetical protein